MPGVRPETIGAVPGGSPSLYGRIPRGVILMWSGRLRDIPAGWALCDGRNGTPNLVGRFIRGINTATTNPGTTGGADSVTVVQNAHQHELPFTPESTNLWHSSVFGTGTSRSFSNTLNGGSGSRSSAVLKDQSLTATNQAHDTRPAYFELAYLMKL